MLILKAKRIFSFVSLYYLFSFIFSPGVSMNIEEDIASNINNKNSTFLILPQQTIEAEEDKIKLEDYVETLLSYNIKAKQTLSPDEKKTTLFLNPANKAMFFSGSGYSVAFDLFPSLQHLSIGFDLPNVNLNLEDLRNIIKLAQNNTSFVHLTSKDFGHWNSNLEVERAQRLLGALLFRNSLMKDFMTESTYNFSLMNNPEEEVAIAEGLQSGHSLKILNICFNGERGKKILKSLKENKVIEKARFSFYFRPLEADEVDSLSYLIINSPSLKSLELAISLDAPLLMGLSNVLKQTPLSLEKLTLDLAKNAGSEQQAMEEATANFFKAFQSNNSLRVLHFGLPLSLENTKTLAEALGANSTLQVLALPGREIGDEGAIHLAEGLKGNKSLKEMDLSATDISDTGANSILSALGINQALTTLHLAGNPISNARKAEINSILDKRKVPVFNFSREISLP